MGGYGLREDMAEILVEDRWIADYFEEVVREVEKIGIREKDCNWIGNFFVNVVIPVYKEIDMKKRKGKGKC